MPITRFARLRPGFFMTRGATSFLNEPNAPIVVRRLSAAEVLLVAGQSAPAAGIEVFVGP